MFCLDGCLHSFKTSGQTCPRTKILVFYQLFQLSLAIPALSLAIPALSLAIPALSLAIPVLPLSIPALSLAVPGIPCCPGIILGFTPVGQEDPVATLCSLSLTMVEAVAKLHLPGIKQGLVLVNMAAMSLQM